MAVRTEPGVVMGTIQAAPSVHRRRNQGLDLGGARYVSLEELRFGAGSPHLRIPFGGRVIRAVVLSLKELSYVEAARGLGASHLRMMARHILPQCVAPYLILATTHLGVAIIIEAALGFLGVGIPPPTPTWGNMLADSLNTGLVPPWWLVLFPGIAITLTVLAFNLLGDGIRDALDPRLRGAV